ncbi:hypothetical protein KAH81_08295 [bacterium]|nr:hypothetical protein [bacterium]
MAGKDSRFALTGLQSYLWSDGSFLAEGFIYQNGEYDSIFSIEGLNLLTYYNMSICPFGRGFLAAENISPKVLYMNTRLDTINTINFSLPSYIPPIKFTGSIETTLEEDYEWTGNWTQTGNVRALNDSIGVVCFQKNGVSEIGFFKPETGQVLGFSKPIPGSLIDVDPNGRLVFISDEFDKQSVKLKIYNIHFQ